MTVSADKLSSYEGGFVARREHVARLCTASLMAALALVLGFIESTLSLPVVIPGFKLGLSNAAVLMALYTTDISCAFAVMCVKVLASGFLFGSPTMIAYSLGGSLLAFLGMLLLKKIPGISVVLVSMIAALLHLLGQLAVASLFLGTGAIFINFVVLALPSCVSGCLIGAVSGGLIHMIDRRMRPFSGVYVPDDFKVRPGKKIAVIGPNGAGKTSFALSLQQSFEKKTNNASYVALCFQNAEDQIVVGVVRDDCAFGLENRGVQRDKMLLEVKDALCNTELEAYECAAVNELSGGELQRLAIAGLYVCEPEIYVFDEASSMLDAAAKARLFAIMDELCAKQKTVVFITQLLDEALKANEIMFFDEGSLVWTGTPDEFLHTEAILDRAEDVGLYMPETLKLSRMLKKEGIDVPISADPCVLEEAIWRLYAKI